jgi:phospholipid/cholesterol/gamma-HCH transport system permease protein
MRGQSLSRTGILIEALKKYRTVWIVYITLRQILYIARLGITMRSIGSNLINLLEVVGGLVMLLIQAVLTIPRPPYMIRELIRQMMVVGWNSIPLIAAILGFIGMITILELNFQLSRVIHSIEYVPGFAGILMFREFGPTVVAAMVAAKVGAGYAAEVGGMKITEQIDALEMLSINPVQYLVQPRLIACVAMQVCLSVFGVAVAFFMGYLISMSHFNFQQYLATMNRFVEIQDFGNLIIKALVLGMVVPIVSCWYGFRASGGAKGVGDATTRAVVTSILIIILLDFTLTTIADRIVEVVFEV